MEFTINANAVTADGVAVEIQVAVVGRSSFWTWLRCRSAVKNAVRSSVRLVVGVHDLEELLHGDLAPNILKRLSVPEVEITTVQITDVTLPEAVVEALAGFVVAEREGRAALARTESEFQNSARLAEAASVLKVPPGYLRWVVALEKIGSAEVSVEAAGPTKLPPDKPVPKPIDPRLAAGLRGGRGQKRDGSWLGGIGD